MSDRRWSATYRRARNREDLESHPARQRIETLFCSQPDVRCVEHPVRRFIVQRCERKTADALYVQRSKRAEEDFHRPKRIASDHACICMGWPAASGANRLDQQGIRVMDGQDRQGSRARFRQPAQRRKEYIVDQRIGLHPAWIVEIVEKPEATDVTDSFAQLTARRFESYRTRSGMCNEARAPATSHFVQQKPPEETIRNTARRP